MQVQINFVVNARLPGVGEATAGPAAAAIGNAVPHARRTLVRSALIRDGMIAALLAG
jgi:CO/xanthine dehydrogenase Mo-binding subunit